MVSLRLVNPIAFEASLTLKVSGFPCRYPSFLPCRASSRNRFLSHPPLPATGLSAMDKNARIQVLPSLSAAGKGGHVEDQEPFWLTLFKDVIWSIRFLISFLLEQPGQLKYTEWPSFQSTLKTATLTLVLVAALIVALSSVDSGLCYLLALVLRRAQGSKVSSCCPCPPFKARGRGREVHSLAPWPLAINLQRRRHHTVLLQTRCLAAVRPASHQWWPLHLLPPRRLLSGHPHLSGTVAPRPRPASHHLHRPRISRAYYESCSAPPDVVNRHHQAPIRCGASAERTHLAAGPPAHHRVLPRPPAPYAPRAVRARCGTLARTCCGKPAHVIVDHPLRRYKLIPSHTEAAEGIKKRGRKRRRSEPDDIKHREITHRPPVACATSDYRQRR